MNDGILLESYDLARAQLEDDVIVATLRSEHPDADIEVSDELRERWGVERMSGVGRMQLTMYKAAIGERDLEGHSVTMLLWMMRQYGGHAPNGVDEEVQREFKKLRKLLASGGDDVVEQVYGALRLVSR